MKKIIPNEEFLRRWVDSVTQDGIPEESIMPEIRVVADLSGKSSYTWGISFNSYRFNRLQQPRNGCPLCEALEELNENPHRILGDLQGFVVIPNKFPSTRGASVAISVGTGTKERSMYTTKSLDNITNEMGVMFEFASIIGMRTAHNGVGAGATVPNHEHWKFSSGTSFTSSYGFEAAELMQVKGYSGLSFVQDFPFAHIVFNINDPEYIKSFLENIGRELGDKFEQGVVPHCIYQAGENVLVTPFKIFSYNGPGAGDTVGHVTVKSQQEFISATYDSLVATLDRVLFRREDIDLKSFV